MGLTFRQTFVNKERFKQEIAELQLMLMILKVNKTN